MFLETIHGMLFGGNYRTRTASSPNSDFSVFLSRLVHTPRSRSPAVLRGEISARSTSPSRTWSSAINIVADTCTLASIFTRSKTKKDRVRRVYGNTVDVDSCAGFWMGLNGSVACHNYLYIEQRFQEVENQPLNSGPTVFYLPICAYSYHVLSCICTYPQMYGHPFF